MAACLPPLMRADDYMVQATGMLVVMCKMGFPLSCLWESEPLWVDSMLAEMFVYLSDSGWREWANEVLPSQKTGCDGERSLEFAACPVLPGSQPLQAQ